MPTDIRILTTAAGRERAIANLLEGPSPQLKALADAYNLGALSQALKPENIHVASGIDGPLDDIGSAEDSAAVADLAATLVRDATADPDATVHVSIAGGRKTMGFLLGATLSLFGRPQDSLSHVLVEPAFEMRSDFFFPPPRSTLLVGRDGSAVDAARARISLADIPFLRLRDRLPSGLLSGAVSYMDIVAAAQASLAEPSMKIDLQREQLVCGGILVPVGPAELAFAAWLARRLIQGLPHQGGMHYTEARQLAFLAEYEGLRNSSPRVREAIARGITKEWFEQRTSRLRRAINDRLGDAARPYLPVLTGKRPQRRTGFTLKATAITIVD